MRFQAEGTKGMIRGSGSIAATLACAAFLIAAPAGAQEKVTGVVKAAGTQLPIAGANVFLLSQPDNQATTEADGSFSIEMVSTAARRVEAGRASAPELRGTRLSFTVTGASSPVAVELLDTRGHQVRSLARGRFAPGPYSLEAAPSGLPAGLYLLRAMVGEQSRSFRLAVVGNAVVGAPGAQRVASAPRLAKAAAGGIDYVIVSKDGYLKKSQEVMAYTDAQSVLLTAKVAATARLGIFTDSTMPMIDWSGATIYSWEQTAQLMTDSTGSLGFNGSAKAIQVSTMADRTWNGWAFHVAVGVNGLQPTVDLSTYEGGSMHLAVKGNAKNIGVMMSSPNQFQGSAPLVDLGLHGYMPDSAWHEVNIPMSEFAGTLKLSDVFIYAGFVSPSGMGSEFDPLATYWVDDIWFEPAK